MLKQFKHFKQFLPKHQRIIDENDHRMPHLAYPKKQAENYKFLHIKPQKIADYTALWMAKFMKMNVNLISGYGYSKMTEKKWLNKTLLLETMSVVPGMVGSMCRHMRALRLFKDDKGWIQQLLQQADNERFHYFTVLSLRKPGFLGRMSLAMMQVIFAGQVFMGYMLSPRHAHKFVGYLEEQGFKHYTELIKQIDRNGSPISYWKDRPASKEAIEYYNLDKNATLRDVFLMIRADELCHIEINHFLGEVDKNFDLNKQKQMMYEDKQIHMTKQKSSQSKIN